MKWRQSLRSTLKWLQTSIFFSLTEAEMLCNVVCVVFISPCTVSSFVTQRFLPSVSLLPSNHVSAPVTAANADWSEDELRYACGLFCCDMNRPQNQYKLSQHSACESKQKASIQNLIEKTVIFVAVLLCAAALKLTRTGPIRFSPSVIGIKSVKRRSEETQKEKWKKKSFTRVTQLPFRVQETPCRATAGCRFLFIQTLIWSGQNSRSTWAEEDSSRRADEESEIRPELWDVCGAKNTKKPPKNWISTIFSIKSLKRVVNTNTNKHQHHEDV